MHSVSLASLVRGCHLQDTPDSALTTSAHFRLISYLRFPDTLPGLHCRLLTDCLVSAGARPVYLPAYTAAVSHHLTPFAYIHRCHRCLQQLVHEAVQNMAQRTLALGSSQSIHSLSMACFGLQGAQFNTANLAKRFVRSPKIISFQELNKIELFHYGCKKLHSCTQTFFILESVLKLFRDLSNH